MVRIIGISGKKLAGKDTLADFLIKELADSYATKAIKISFADALKEEVYEFVLKPNGIPKEYLYNQEYKHYFRLILQGWGTDFKRKLVRDDYWIVKFTEKIEKLKKEKFNGIVIVPDVRFQNEVSIIEKLGGMVIRINRPPSAGFIKKLLYNLNIHKDKHPSEVDLDDYPFDNIIVNDWSLYSLENKAKEFIKTNKDYLIRSK